MFDSDLCAAVAHRPEPTWVFDVDREGMVFGNRAACDFWRAPSVDELVARDFSSDMSSATRSRLARRRAWSPYTVPAPEPGGY
ncbi:MAG: hypothetical protein AAFU79_19200, partial [Myxococcota bacterium]